MASKFKINNSKDGKHVIVIGPYNPDFVDEVHRRIPYDARIWKQAGKFWKIDARYRDVVEQIITDLEETVELS